MLPPGQVLYNLDQLVFTGDVMQLIKLNISY